MGSHAESHAITTYEEASSCLLQLSNLVQHLKEKLTRHENDEKFYAKIKPKLTKAENLSRALTVYFTGGEDGSGRNSAATAAFAPFSAFAMFSNSKDSKKKELESDFKDVMEDLKKIIHITGYNCEDSQSAAQGKHHKPHHHHHRANTHSGGGQQAAEAGKEGTKSSARNAQSLETGKISSKPNARQTPKPQEVAINIHEDASRPAAPTTNARMFDDPAFTLDTIQFEDASLIVSREGEETAKQIEEETVQLQQISKEVYSLVHQQGKDVEVIVDDVTTTKVKAEQAVSDLIVAEKQQRAARTKQILVILLLVAGLIGGGVYLIVTFT